MATMQPKLNDLWFPDLAHEAISVRWHIRQAQGPASCGDSVDVGLARLFALHGMGVEHSPSDSDLGV